jgi:hypothetical protein
MLLCSAEKRYILSTYFCYKITTKKDEANLTCRACEKANKLHKILVGFHGEKYFEKY